MTTPLPCVSCGSPPYIDDQILGYVVSCPECYDLGSYAASSPSRDAAVEAWNEHAEEERDSQRDRLKQSCKGCSTPSELREGDAL